MSICYTGPTANLVIISGCSPNWIVHFLMLIVRLVVHPQSFAELGHATPSSAVPITTQALGGIFVSWREMWFKVAFSPVVCGSFS